MKLIQNKKPAIPSDAGSLSEKRRWCLKDFVSFSFRPLPTTEMTVNHNLKVAIEMPAKFRQMRQVRI
jgi:hypothetical protein